MAAEPGHPSRRNVPRLAKIDLAQRKTQWFALECHMIRPEASQCAL
jgi:hypothetical protein